MADTKVTSRMSKMRGERVEAPFGQCPKERRFFYGFPRYGDLLIICSVEDLVVLHFTIVLIENGTIQQDFIVNFK